MRTRLNAFASCLMVVLATTTGCGDAAPAGKADITASHDARTPVDPNVEPTNDEPQPPDDEPNPPDEPNPMDEAPEPRPTDDPLPKVGRTAWATQRNGLLKQGIATSTLPANLELLWRREIPYGVPATCAIVGEHVYVPTLEGFLYCLERTSGDVVWKYRSIENPDPKKFAPGFTAAPTITDDTIFTGDEDGYVHAINRANGTKRWTFDTLGEVAGGPTVIGENGESILVTSHGGGLFRLKVDDGEVEWKVGEIGPINLSPPVVDGRTFALGCETGALVTVDVANGEELARLPLEESTLATPAIVGEHMYLGLYDGRVLSIEYATGDITWTFLPKRTLEFHASCAATEDAVYAAGRNKLLHRLDRETGEEVWSYATGAQNNAGPVVAGDRVFFASDDKHVYGVTTEKGEEAFKYNLESTPTAAPAVGEGVLVIGTEGNPGAVFCFGAR